MTTTVDLGRARALFDDPALAWIIDRLQARLEHGRPLLDARLRLNAPTDAQREAFLRLTARPLTRSRSIGIDTTDLMKIVVDAEIAPDLPTLVTALRGPVSDRRRARDAAEAAWRAVHRRLRQDAVALDPRLEPWADELEAIGLLSRLAGDADSAVQLADRALAVIRQLPAGGIPLAQLAATTLGDSHALDDGTPCATLVLRAIEARTGLPRRDRSAAERRALWARAGVLLDELSAPALVLDLRPAGDGLLARTLRAHAEAGEPCRVTLRQLVRHPPDWSPLFGATVAVCENPAVLAAAADRLGAACPPLICTEGQPSSAVQVLLGQLGEAGAALWFHTDFDAGGLRIGNLLVDRFGARPWRMRREDYEAAVREDMAPLATPPDEVSWDPELATAIADRGQAVHEERLIDLLLRDLESWA